MRKEELLRQIDLYLKGELSEQDVDRLWEEFIKNPEYLQLLEIDASLRKHFLSDKKTRNTPGPEDTYHKKKGGRMQKLSSPAKWVGGIAAVLAIFVLVQVWVTPTEPDLQSLALTEISPHEMVTMDIYRSESEWYDPLDVEINAGFEAAVSGRTEESLERFESILAGSPTPLQKAVVALNTGILHYNRAEPDKAVEAFERALEGSVLTGQSEEKAWWLMGHSLIRMERYEDAYSAMDRVVRLDRSFRDDARQIKRLLEESLH